MNQYRLEALDLRTATEAESRAVSALFNQMRAEDLPEDPPVPFEEHLARWRNRPEYRVAFDWLVRAPQEQAIGFAEADYDEVPQNRHLLWFGIYVQPEFRRHGLARGLLALLAQMAERVGRSVWITETSAQMSVGEAFLERIGGERGLEHKTNQLLLAELDRDLLRRWIAAAPGEEFELGL
jgi:GNAT superfamily N-acetyltransferase